MKVMLYDACLAWVGWVILSDTEVSPHFRAIKFEKKGEQEFKLIRWKPFWSLESGVESIYCRSTAVES